mgnify:CR=1 FL=1
MKLIVAILLFLSPLAFTTFNEDSFDLPKTVFVRVATFILLLITLYRTVEVKDKKFSLSSIDIVLLSWLGVLLISTLLSINIHLSLQGLYKFYTYGFINYICMYILYCTSKNIEDINIAKISILSSVIVSLYSFLQYSNITLFGLKFGYTRSWIFSTIGNPVYVGNFLSLCFIFSLVFYLIEKKIHYLLSTIIIWAGIIISQCRSAWIATALTLSITTYACYKYHKLYLKHITTVFLLLIATFLLFSLPYSSQILSRAKSIVSYKDNIARIENWYTALRIFSHFNIPYGNREENKLLRLFFGSGPDTFYYIFPGYKTLGYVNAAGRNVTAAHAHNELLQLLTTTGISGAVAYLLLMCLSVFYSIKLFAKSKALKLIIFFLFFTTYYLNSMFNPTTVVPVTYFFIFLAIFHSYLVKECYIKEFKFKLPNSIFIPFAICAIVINTAILYITLRMYAVDVIFFNCKSINDDLQNKEKKLFLVTKLAPHNVHYSLELIRCWKEIAHGTENITLKKYYLANVTKENKRITTLFPSMPDFWYNLGVSYMWYWQLTGERYLDEKSDAMKLAKEAFLNAIRVSPVYVDGYNTLGKYFGAIGKEKIGLHFWNMAILLDPTMEEARKYLERVSKKWTSGKN